MSEREARILGSGEPFKVTFERDGKEVTEEFLLKPVRARQLCDIERDALRHFKRDYLSTYTDNQDVLGLSQNRIDEEVAKVACWDLSNLPQKDAYSVSNVTVGEWEKGVDDPNFIAKESVLEWIRHNYGDPPETERGIKAVLTHGLDTSRLKPEELKEMTGDEPTPGRVRYDQWWITAATEGQVAFVFSSINAGSNGQKIVTREQVKDWPLQKVIEAAKTVEQLTMAQVENT